MLISYNLLANSPGEDIYPNKDISKRLIDRSLVGAVGMALMYYNLTTLPIHIFSTIARTSVIFTYMISISIGRDIFSWKKMGCILLCILGAVLVIGQDSKKKSKDIPITNFAVFLGFVNALIAAINPIMIESVGKVNPLHNSLYISGFTIVTSVILLIVTNKTVLIVWGTQMILQLMSGLGGFFMQTTRVLSLRYEKATVVQVINSLSLVYSFLYQSIVMGEPPTVTGWIGGAIVFFSTVAYTLFKGSKQKDNSQKQKQPASSLGEMETP